MFSKYFEDVERRLIAGAKKTAAAPSKKGKAASAEKAAKPVKKAAVDHTELIAYMEKIVPASLKTGALKMIDVGGYIPEGIDFVAYKEICRDMPLLMGGYVPSELVYGTYHVCPVINKNSIVEVLDRIVQAKKINRFADDAGDIQVIPAFIISYGMDMNLSELKGALLDYYMTRSIDSVFEFDLIAVLNRGLFVKNWREKRSFIGLETGKDTLMWFFILMNEYLDVDRGGDLDLREYIRKTEKYSEY